MLRAPPMEYSFPRYLLAKQTVDDRALNKDVLTALKSHLSTANIRLSASHQPSVPQSAFNVIEVGAGIGTMLTRLLRWNILPPNVDYTLVDEMPENIAFARQWLPQWAQENGYQVETLPDETIHFSVSTSIPQSIFIHFKQSDVFDYIRFSASQSDSALRSSDASVAHSVPPSADLLIAHAFLDLLPMPESLPQLFSLLKPGGLAWLTINFDGVTTLEPPFRSPDSSALSSDSDIRFSDSSVVDSASHIRFSDSSAVDSASHIRFSDSSVVDSASDICLSTSRQPSIPESTADDLRLPDSSAAGLRFSDSSVVDIRLSAPQSVPESVDSLIERLYHQTMDTRPTGGDSRSGRHLFKHLAKAGAEILAAGASDWVVYPVKGQYPADEAYFLHFILHFFETSLANHPELDPHLLAEWLKQRRAQIERAELIYIAHQMDFLISTH